MNRNERTKKLCDLGGLVLLSGLNRKVEDPATLLGLLLELETKVDDLNAYAFSRYKEEGLLKMQNRNRKKESIVPSEKENLDEGGLSAFEILG